jgi:hypothetical protein
MSRFVKQWIFFLWLLAWRSLLVGWSRFRQVNGEVIASSKHAKLLYAIGRIGSSVVLLTRLVKIAQANRMTQN